MADGLEGADGADRWSGGRDAPSTGDASFAKTELVHRLCAWQEAEGRSGRVLTDVFVRLQDAFLAPDVAWWGAGREPKIQPGAIDTVPDVVVEVLSPGTRDNDLGAKRGRYLGSGVRELWLINPADRSAVLATASGEKRLRAADELTSTLLAGFRIPLSDLLA